MVTKSQIRLSDFAFTFLQGIFQTQGSNPSLLHFLLGLLLSHQGSQILT